MIRRVVILALAMLCAGCASVPRNPYRVGCQFDKLGRWQYVLIVESSGGRTAYLLRNKMSASPDRQDTEVRVAPSSSVRIGYCPDEATIGRGADRQR